MCRRQIDDVEDGALKRKYYFLRVTKWPPRAQMNFACVFKRENVLHLAKENTTNTLDYNHSEWRSHFWRHFASSIHFAYICIRVINFDAAMNVYVGHLLMWQLRARISFAIHMLKSSISRDELMCSLMRRKLMRQTEGHARQTLCTNF